MSEHRHARSAPRRSVPAGAVAAAGTAAMIAIMIPHGAQGADRPIRNMAAPLRVTTSPAPTGVQGSGLGPLTKDEVDKAKSLALAADPMTGARDVNGRPGPEYLDSDLADAAAGGDQARRVEVVFYDYATGKLVKRTVNLASGKVEATDAATGMQPSPSRAESERAADLLIKSPLGAGLRADFKAAAKGTELTSAAQLTLRGISYSTAEQSGPPALAACGTHRCVRLFTEVKGGPWIDTTDLVVDLSAGTVGRIHP